MNAACIRDDVMEMLKELLSDGEESLELLGEDDNLFAVGFSSLSTISLVILIEEKYDIVLEDEDLLFENYNTVNKIIHLIERYL